MDSNQDKLDIPMDCQGTCKTPIGCTCVNANEDEPNVLVNENVLTVVTTNEPQKPHITKKSNCQCKAKKGGCCNGTHKLEVYNWLEDLPEAPNGAEMVEVQFKNTRKGYYLNSNNVELYKGDIVAVEATPGHDIGEVTLTGKLVQLQMLKSNHRGETKRIYRIAKQSDVEKWEESKAKEHKTMLRSREIAEELNLNMKISDVEYQGDGNKAVFYYIADERVDFRQLIKVYASEFRVKIEMKQIGARQEAGRVGGIGSCGRELCCSSSMSNFISVSTSAARLQDIPLNPQKLAGQCGKLKCCLNFEVDTYVEAQRKLPSRETVLDTKDSSYYHFKTDILSGTMIYSTDKYFAANLITLSRDRVHDVIRMNKKGDKPLHLATDVEEQSEKPTSHDILQENISRFDENKNRKKKFVKNNKGDNSKQLNIQPAGSNNKQLVVNTQNVKKNNKPQQQVENNKQGQSQGQNQSQTQSQTQTQGQNQNRNKGNKNKQYRNNRPNRNGNAEQKKPEA